DRVLRRGRGHAVSERAFREVLEDLGRGDGAGTRREVFGGEVHVVLERGLGLDGLRGSGEGENGNGGDEAFHGSVPFSRGWRFATTPLSRPRMTDRFRNPGPPVTAEMLADTSDLPG